ncbi:MAG: 50S ribosomal protein L29 [Candidatus Daviesbacteria bacterium]|nr:50S ribosomal protein L29 [Candidatus Daviesbacteria bacterium]
MKRQEFLEIKKMDIKEISVKMLAARQELLDLSLDKNMKKLKDLKSVAKKRKEIAQMLTVIRQKQLLGEIEVKVSKIKKEKEAEVEKEPKKRSRTVSKK